MQNYLKNITKKITENLPDDLEAIKRGSPAEYSVTYRIANQKS